MWIPKIEINESFQMFLLEKFGITFIKNPIYSVLYDDEIDKYTIFVSDSVNNDINNISSTIEFYLSDYQNWLRSKKIKKLQCSYLEKI